MPIVQYRIAEQPCSACFPNHDLPLSSWFFCAASPCARDAYAHLPTGLGYFPQRSQS